MKKTIAIVLFLTALLSGACLGPGSSKAGLAQATPTATPFLPAGSIAETDDDRGVSPVAASSIDYSVGKDVPISWGEYPAPSAFSDIAVPQPMGILPKPEGQVNILLMGSDQRPNDGGYRTDVLLLLSLNPGEGTVSLVSFPRDLYIYQPGWRVDRINTAQARGGFELTSMTFEYNFGVKPDHWVLINFDGFRSIIDALGGIYVQVGQPLSDHRDGYGDYSVAAGQQFMDSETALWYVRSRGSSNDFERTRRQQEVLQGIFFRLLSLNAITNAPQLYEQYKAAVQTDMAIGDILPLLTLAGKVGDSGSIERYVVGPEQVEPFVTSSGGQVLLPQQSAVKELMRAALHSP